MYNAIHAGKCNLHKSAENGCLLDDCLMNVCLILDMILRFQFNLNSVKSSSDLHVSRSCFQPDKGFGSPTISSLLQHTSLLLLLFFVCLFLFVLFFICVSWLSSCMLLLRGMPKSELQYFYDIQTASCVKERSD